MVKLLYEGILIDCIKSEYNIMLPKVVVCNIICDIYDIIGHFY